MLLWYHRKLSPESAQTFGIEFCLGYITRISFSAVFLEQGWNKEKFSDATEYRKAVLPLKAELNGSSPLGA